jgi:calcineurin-like phosphoesterase family protein
MIYFTADTHFNHTNIIKYCNRPFKSVEEMNETIINNWNKKVNDTDIVYHLGDFSWGNPVPFLEKINGKIFIIPGNHDYRYYNFFKKLYENDHYIFDSIKVLNNHMECIVMSHCCQRVWHKSHYNSWHLFAHSHGELEPEGKSMDVGVDTNNFELYSYDDIIETMKTKPDNFNFIKKEKTTNGI